MEKKIAGILLTILILSLELNSTLLIRVSAQPEELAKKLEEYLGKAIPEDLLAEECEYVVPEGFNLTLAERLWRDFSLYVSTGCTTSELRSEVKKIYGNSSLIKATLSNGETIGLNVSSVSVERSLEDGSVSVKIPVASSTSLNYTRYNFTKQAGFYEAWNKTLVREYRVWRREQGWYVYTFEDLVSNKSFTVVSRIWGESSRVEETWLEGLRKLGGGAWNEPVRYLPSFEYTKWGWLRVNGPVIAVPGHYEEVRLLYPEHRRSFKVLFPAYDPAIIEGWVVDVNVSSTSLNTGETLEISYLAEYCSPFGGEPEPLNATLSLEAPGSFEPLSNLETKLDDAHTSGVFRLKAVKPGTYNITLRLEGNAVFANTASNEEAYTIQIVSPPAPSLSIETVERDTSVLKHAKLVLRIRNNGGGVARNIVLEITGSNMEGFARSIGSIEAGEARDVELTLRLLQPSSLAKIIVRYSDDDGNPYLVSIETMVSTETFWVPEHFEEYTVVVPEHEETLRVFVPGYEAATHIRFYALWDERILGEAIFRAERLHETPYYETSLSMGLIPVPVPGLGVELSMGAGREALTEAGVNIMVKTIEPYYEHLGVLSEDDVLRLVDADKQSLRIGNISSDYRVEPLKPYWVEGKPIVLNETQLALYQAMMDEVKKANPDIDYDYKETLIDVRTKVGKAEPGYIVLTYHPLKVVGEGPLRSIRVRNFAGIGLDYRVNVETFILTVFGKTRSENGWKHLFLGEKEDAVLLSSTLDQVYDREVFINITFNGRLVAKARFILKHESSPYWKGFWDGLASQAWKIAITVGLMVIVGFIVPAQHVVTASQIILGVGVAMNLLEVGMDVYNAYLARDEMNTLASEYVNKSIEYSNKKMPEHAAECLELAHRLRIEANATIENLGVNALSGLAADVTWDEISIALGWKEPLVLPGESKEYKVGYATGRVAGAVVLCMLYAALYTMMVKIKAERIMGQPLSIIQVLKLMARGVYNWITPAIWDATILAVERKGAVFFSRISDLLLGNKYSRRFGEAIGNLVGSIKADPPKVDEALEISTEISKQVVENVPSRESSSKILDAIGTLIERYSPDELKEKGGTVARSIVSIWVKDGDEAIDSLNSWLSVNSKDIEKMKALDNILLEIEGDAAKGVGLEIGNIVDGYLKVRGIYDEDTGNTFLNIVLKNPDALNELLAKMASAKNYFFDYNEKPHVITLKRGGYSDLNLGKDNQLEPGVYRVKVYWRYSDEEGCVEFLVSKDVKSEYIAIPEDHVNKILDEINVDEAIIRITGVKSFEYIPELYFPKSFPLGGNVVNLNLISAEVTVIDGFYGKPSKLPIINWELRSIKGEAALAITTEAKDMYGSNNLILTFYEGGRVKYRDRFITDIEVYRGRWTIKYMTTQGMVTPMFIVGKYITVPQELKMADDVRGVTGLKTLSLKERIFKSGYYLYGLEKVGNEDISADERLVIRAWFIDENGNYKPAFCMDPDLKVRVPEGATEIVSIEVLKYPDVINDLDECIRMLKHYPDDKYLIGQVGELIAKSSESTNIMLSKYLDEISKETGIPKDKMNLVWHKWVYNPDPDLKVVVPEDVTDKYGNLIKGGSIIAIGEVKSTSTCTPANFKNGINNCRSSLENFFNRSEFESVKYGIAIVLAYNIDNPPSGKSYDLPPKIGDYGNPYMELIKR